MAHGFWASLGICPLHLSSRVCCCAAVPVVSQPPFVSVLASSCICTLRIIHRLPDHQPFNSKSPGKKAIKYGVSMLLCRMVPLDQCGNATSGSGMGCMDWTPGTREDPGTLPTQQLASTMSSSGSEAPQLPEGCFGFCYPSHILQMGNRVACSKPQGQYLARYEIRSILLKCFDGYASSLSFTG